MPSYLGLGKSLNEFQLIFMSARSFSSGESIPTLDEFIGIIERDDIEAFWERKNKFVENLGSLQNSLIRFKRIQMLREIVDDLKDDKEGSEVKARLAQEILNSNYSAGEIKAVFGDKLIEVGYVFLQEGHRMKLALAGLDLHSFSSFDFRKATEIDPFLKDIKKVADSLEEQGFNRQEFFSNINAHKVIKDSLSYSRTREFLDPLLSEESRNQVLKSKEKRNIRFSDKDIKSRVTKAIEGLNKLGIMPVPAAAAAQSGGAGGIVARGEVVAAPVAESGGAEGVVGEEVGSKHQADRQRMITAQEEVRKQLQLAGILDGDDDSKSEDSDSAAASASTQYRGHSKLDKSRQQSRDVDGK